MTDKKEGSCEILYKGFWVTAYKWFDGSVTLFDDQDEYGCPNVGTELSESDIEDIRFPDDTEC